jgi:hypothetical protein
MRMRHIVIFRPAPLYSISPYYLINGQDFRKKFTDTKCVFSTNYLYCCTVHFEDSPITKTNKCTNMCWVDSKTRIKTLKKLLHVSIYRSSSGSTCCCCCWAFVASHECTAACWLIVPPAFERSNFSLLDVPAPIDPFRTPAAEVRTTMSGNRPINFAEMPISTVHLGIF